MEICRSQNNRSHWRNPGTKNPGEKVTFFQKRISKFRQHIPDTLSRDRKLSDCGCLMSISYILLPLLVLFLPQLIISEKILQNIFFIFKPIGKYFPKTMESSTRKKIEPNKYLDSLTHSLTHWLPPAECGVFSSLFSLQISVYIIHFQFFGEFRFHMHYY